jgi:hypothetical protein
MNRTLPPYPWNPMVEKDNINISFIKIDIQFPLPNCLPNRAMINPNLSKAF